jgi:hypothetical protein
MNKANGLVNEHKVKVFYKGGVVLEKVVRSKASRTAVTNVLTNIFKGELDRIEVEQLTFNTKIEENVLQLPNVETPAEAEAM